MRILLVGPGTNFKFGARFYYSYVRRLLNGFVSNGHFVLQFSDRDHADYALGLRSLGKRMANRRLIEMATSLDPHLVCLVHAELIAPETIATLRRELPRCRVAWVDFDPLTNPRFAERLDRKLEMADCVFATSGGTHLRRIARDRRAYFIPNPVDTAMDDECAFESTSNEADVFFCCGDAVTATQWSRALALRAAAPELRCSYHGTATGRGLWGHAHMATMARARIGLNLNKHEGGLYASDRMAQYLGNGLLLATDRASGYQAYFSDDEMIFYSGISELADACRRAARDDAWRQRARKGRDKALAIMANTLVAKFILSTCRGDAPPDAWVFPQYGET